MSSPVPPRLTPTTDAAFGGALKTHLHQQRRASRNMSPVPDRDYVVKNVSGHRLNSPLQTAFDPQGTYTYHFSSSTLDRAQKAKEQLELMAQYRRLLHFLPPLTPEASNRSRPTTSDPLSPTISKSSTSPFGSSQQPPLGRPYNPLQYIRNRRVRARERKTIDGETMGFSDVMKVSGWVDEAAASVANSPLSGSSSSLPPFPGAQGLEADRATPSQIPRPATSMGKPKRPRIDWSIDPADMLADAYWLEQNDNKYIIEDRHYNKIFPPKQEVLRPSSKHANETGKAMITGLDPGTSQEKNPRSSLQLDSSRPPKGETDMSRSGARDRARQRLHELKGSHRHSTSIHTHDFLRFRKGSFSDSSENEGDRRRRYRSGTLSANDTDLLDKQMMEILAQEAHNEQKELSDVPSDKELKVLPEGMITPDRVPQPANDGRSPQDSSPALVDTQEKALHALERQTSPFRPGRPSLEVPGPNYRPSLEFDSSVPASPDLGPSRTGSSYVPTIGADLSPLSSRPGSPVRRPFHKVKNIFRDRSRERGSRQEKELKLVTTGEKEKGAESPVELPEESVLTPPISTERPQSLDLPRSKSPAQLAPPKATAYGHKSQRSMGSIRFRSDETPGLRSIFKGGAKIDGIIREGVSKVGDFIWRKDSERDDSSSSTSSDESDAEQKSGQAESGVTTQPDAKAPKTYAGTLPLFKSLSGTDNDDKAAQGNMLSIGNSISRSPTPRADRFDKLKPPRIDVGGDPISVSPALLSPRHGGPDIFGSDESTRGDVDKRLGDVSKEPGSVAAVTASPTDRPEGDTSKALTLRSREWSLAERGPSSPRRAPVSKREVARVRALILSSGIKAIEIARRAQESQPLFAPPYTTTAMTLATMDDGSGQPYPHHQPHNHQKTLVAGEGMGLSWTDVQGLVAFFDENASKTSGVNGLALTARQADLFPATARVLEDSIERSTTALRASGAEFTSTTGAGLQGRAEALRARLATDLAERTRRCADDADDAARELLATRRLEAKRATDAMDSMLRRRRRRFRWARRAGWLVVEYLLVGLMWYVWFVVMICRVVAGLGHGLWGAVRWLLWL